MVVVSMPTPAAFTRMISEPRLATATAPLAGLNKPVLASLALRSGFVAFTEVPNVTLALIGPVMLLAGIPVRPEPSPVNPGMPVAVKPGAVTWPPKVAALLERVMTRAGEAVLIGTPALL